MARLAIGVVAGVVATILLAVGIWLIVVYTGAYNVAASDRHADPVRWTLDTVMHRSVAGRADSVKLPDTPSREMLTKGAGHYEESCAHCHGAPGHGPAHWSRRMRPEPPHLAEAATRWKPAEVHWIVANGIKMSGMPAFGEHYDAEQIVALTAYVSALPGLTPEDYAALTGAAAGHGAGTAHQHR